MNFKILNQVNRCFLSICQSNNFFLLLRLNYVSSNKQSKKRGDIYARFLFFFVVVRDVIFF